MPESPTPPNQSSSLLPIPEVSAQKKYFSESHLELGELAQTVDDVEYELVLEQKHGRTPTATLKNGQSAAYKDFYSAAMRLMRNLKPHLAKEDITQFKRSWKALKDRMNPELYSKDNVGELSEFLQQALKNANLSELGVKSREDELENEIDVSQL